MLQQQTALHLAQILLQEIFREVEIMVFHHGCITGKSVLVPLLEAGTPDLMTFQLIIGPNFKHYTRKLKTLIYLLEL